MSLPPARPQLRGKLELIRPQTGLHHDTPAIRSQLTDASPASRRHRARLSRKLAALRQPAGALDTQAGARPPALQGQAPGARRPGSSPAERPSLRALLEERGGKGRQGRKKFVAVTVSACILLETGSLLPYIADNAPWCAGKCLTAGSPSYLCTRLISLPD
ncbi:unnamed protein product [Rangifer tarandus platyrhynchus]|uniref:Uncharacterized protein n=1 Tax=Rangifer tarandus platyrhynchus TaxID=3082113 RepID=A0ABN8ZUX0_RANTA|nr:unnamed protein product [Rangifer tarandus platyrhynchus]